MPVVMVSLRLDYFKNRLDTQKWGCGIFGGLLSHCWVPLSFLYMYQGGVTLSSFPATSQTCPPWKGGVRGVAGGWRPYVLFCKLFSLSICHLVLKRCVHCLRWPPGGQGQCILGLPWGVLGWPKTLFGLLHRWRGKTQMNFLANSIYWGGGLVSPSCPTFLQPHRLTVAGQVSSIHGIFKARILEWFAIAISSSRDFPNPGIVPASPALAGGYFTNWGTQEAWYIAVGMKF